jgi:transcriptional regulator with GAF, ATPase, and Fis domain
VILPEHLPPAIQTPIVQDRGPASGRTLDDTMEDVERQLIVDALARAGGVQVRAARLLGITEQSLWYRMKKYGIVARVPGAPPTAASPMVPEGRLPAARGHLRSV